MYSITCLFPWMPRRYDFRVAAMEVFNITTDQLVAVRKQRKNNIVIFTLASEEIFNSLSGIFCRVLFFPLMGHDIVECFAYPRSPQYQFLKLSANSDYDAEDAWDVYLCELGTVLYRRYLCDTMPLTTVFRTDTIGVVLLRKAKTTPLAIEFNPGNGQETDGTVMPYVPPDGAGNTEEDSEEALQQIVDLIQRLLSTAPILSDGTSDDIGADLEMDTTRPGLGSPLQPKRQ